MHSNDVFCGGKVLSWSLPSIKHERTGSLPTALAIKGKRDEKSFPAREISRTPTLSRRARMRNPSCLIS